MDGPDDEARVTALLGRLASAEPRRRVTALRALAGAPVAEPRLLRAAEGLLTDETLTVLSIPYVFGEVRWRAAEAVAALRGALQVREAVRLLDVPVPLSTNDIGELARRAGLEGRRGGIDGVLETLQRLRALGCIRRRDIVRQA